MTTFELISELLKVEDKTQPVEVIWDKINCGKVVKVWQSSKHNCIVLETSIPEAE